MAESVTGWVAELVVVFCPVSLRYTPKYQFSFNVLLHVFLGRRGYTKNNFLSMDDFPCSDDMNSRTVSKTLCMKIMIV